MDSVVGSGTHADGQWCPLLDRECSDRCAWADVVVTMTEDGMEREMFCCVTMLTACMVDYIGSAEECGHGLG